MTRLPNHTPKDPRVQRGEFSLPDNQYATLLALPDGMIEVTVYQLNDDQHEPPTILAFVTITSALTTVVIADKVRDLSRVGE